MAPPDPPVPEQQQQQPHATSATHSAVVSFVPGAVQGATTIVLGHPLDTLKTRQQAAYVAVGDTANRPTSLWRLAAKMARVEGVHSFYRGVAPPLIVATVKRSAQFALFDNFQALFLGAHTSTAAPSTSAWAPFLSGAAAGASGTVVGCPMNVIKIQTQNTSRSVVRNAWWCMFDIYHRDGWRGYYRGWRQHLTKDACFAGMYLGTYTTLKGQLARGNGFGGKTMDSFVAGSVSSMMTWLVLFPLDTIKTMVQATTSVHGGGGGDRGATTTMAVWRHVITSGGSAGAGVRQLYRGLGAAMLRAGPVNGLAMVTYETTKSYVA